MEGKLKFPFFFYWNAAACGFTRTTVYEGALPWVPKGHLTKTYLL